MAVHVPPRIFRRVPFESAVRLKFERFRGFVEQYSANLSLGGMFIRTDDPEPVGTEMPIEFRLGEDYELIRGRGRVAWVRSREDARPEHPAGMGIRFLELTPGSRELIFKMVERRVREGGDPFDLDEAADLLPDRPPEPGPRFAPAEAGEGDTAAAPFASLLPTPLADLEPLPEPPERVGGGGQSAAEPAVSTATSTPAGEPPRAPSPSPASPAQGQLPLGDGAAEETAPGGTASDDVVSGEPAPGDGRVDDPGDALGELHSLDPADLDPADLDPADLDPQSREDRDGMEAGAGSPVPERPAPERDDALVPDEPAAAVTAARPGGEPDDPGQPAGGEADIRIGAGEPATSAAGAPAAAPEAGSGTGASAAGPGAAFPDPGDDAWEAGGSTDVAEDDGGSGGWGDGEDPAPAAFWEADGPAADDDSGDDPGVPAAAGLSGAAVAGASVSGEDAGPSRRFLGLAVAAVLVLALAAGAWWFGLLPLGGSPGDAGTSAEAGPGAAATGADDAGPGPDQPAGGETDSPGPSDAPPADAGATPAATPGQAAAGRPETTPRDAASPAAGDDLAGVPAPARRRPPPPPETADGGATRVEDVSFVTQGGATLILVRTDRPLDAADVVDFRLDGGDPRHVVRLLGIEEPYGSGTVPVGTAQVRRVRSGLHGGEGERELHLVVDLASPGARVRRVETLGDRIRIEVEGAP